MKATVVPAQVTTVEDRVAGNLSFMQLILFAIPIFGGSLLYVILPPSMDIAFYKVVLVCLLAIFGLTMAVRIKGKIVLLWLVVLLRYQLRPRWYLFNKNTLIHREMYPATVAVAARPAASTVRVAGSAPRIPSLELHERAMTHAAIDNPLSRVRFETTKKGGLNVHLTEVKE